jgi:hypothetical protein
MEELSFRWFSLYYLALGILLITGGGYIFARIQSVTDYVIHAAKLENPPSMWVRIVKYFFMFTIPCIILSFFPFSWPELIFSIWCLIIVFTTGQLLAYWKHTSQAIKENSDQIPKKTRFISFNMVSLGFIMLLLFYHLQTRFAI